MIKKKLLKTRFKARFRKNKRILKEKIESFFGWVKGAEIVELPTCNTKEDPVRGAL